MYWSIQQIFWVFAAFQTVLGTGDTSDKGDCRLYSEMLGNKQGVEEENNELEPANASTAHSSPLPRMCSHSCGGPCPTSTAGCSWLITSALTFSPILPGGGGGERTLRVFPVITLIILRHSCILLSTRLWFMSSIMRAEDNRHPIDTYWMMNIQSPDHVKILQLCICHWGILKRRKKNFWRQV